MSFIFDSIKTRNLDQVYEINLNQYYYNLVTGELPDSERIDADFCVTVYSGINHQEFNAVVQVDISDNFEEVHKEVASYFSEKKVDYTWYVIPSTEPDNRPTQE